MLAVADLGAIIAVDETSTRPKHPGNNEAERMSNALGIVLNVTKSDLLKREVREKRAREKKRAKKAG